ncbi:MAG: hypothetical protein AAGC96_04845 [Pseudomonadota bacterium]
MDRFRDLERAGETGRKDAALLAAIAGFEALKHPTFHDLRQFANLFIGLFTLTGEKTRRTAAAALSRFDDLPQEICMIVADQPIRISAPFLALNPSISDPVLLQVISRHGGPHARAISRRSSLSKKVVELLSALNDDAVARSLRLRHGIEAPVPAFDPEAIAARRADDSLRDRIKDMALTHANARPAAAGRSAEIGRPDHSQLVRFAEPTQRQRFKALLARAMGAEEDLADRILLDESGTQLAMALQTLNMPDAVILGALVGFFPALRQVNDGIRHADALLQSIEPMESAERVAAWVRANAPLRTRDHIHHEPLNNNSENNRRPLSARSVSASTVSAPGDQLKRA